MVYTFFMKYLTIFFIFLTSLNSLEFTYKNIKEFKINLDEVQYVIEAKEKKVDYDKLGKFRFFNKEKIISNSSYYTDGKFLKKNIYISFDKAYFLEGMFIMHNIQGNLGGKKISGKKAIYFKNKINFNKVYLYDNKKRIRKISYIYHF